MSWPLALQRCGGLGLLRKEKACRRQRVVGAEQHYVAAAAWLKRLCSTHGIPCSILMVG